MIFRQLFDQKSFTYTYLLADESTRQTILIDPVFEKIDEYLHLLEELSLTLYAAIDTHTHADHVSAIGPLRDKTGCLSLLGEQSNNACVSQTFKDGEKLTIGDLTITAIHTPGHTDDSYSFVAKNVNSILLFTGDTLLIRGSGRTDFQQGDARQQYHSLFYKLLSYDDDAIVYPAHDYKGWSMSTIGEEKRNNPRLQVSTEDEYVTIMNNLDLPNPKMMDIAVPINQQCGKPKRM